MCEHLAQGRNLKAKRPISRESNALTVIPPGHTEEFTVEVMVITVRVRSGGGSGGANVLLSVRAGAGR